MYWYMEVMRKYAVFDGRARRKEYWMFQLFNFIIIVSLVLATALFIPLFSHGDRAVPLLTWVGVFLGYLLATLLPGLAVSARRLHDTNLSGWWILLALVPAGGIALVVLHVLDSTPGQNRYGPNPKGVAATPLSASGAKAMGAAAAGNSVQVSNGQWFLGYCNTCGTPIQAGMRFCPKCGHAAY